MRPSGERRLLRPSLQAYGQILPLVVALGIISSAAEAVGIGLFLPLFDPRYVGSNQTYGGVIGRIVAGATAQFPRIGRTGVLVILILSALAIKAAISYSNGLLSTGKNLQIGHELRSRLYAQLLNSGYTFVSHNEWGTLLETLSMETWRTTEALSAAVSLITNACTVAVFVALLLFLSWRLMIAVAFCMLVISTVLRWIRHPVARHGQRAVELNGKLGELMVDGILGVRTIEAFNLQDHIQSRFDQASDRVRKALIKVERWSGLVSPCAEISSSLLLLGLLLLSMGFKAEWPVLLVTVMMIYRLQVPFKQLETARVAWSASRGAVMAVFELLERTRTDVHAVSSARMRFQHLETAITFDHVSFTYPGVERSSLSDVDVEIPRGKVTAIVGVSGAGKTTLLNLVCGLRQPSAGEIMINGVPLREIEPHSWRARLALASQDVHLFNTTVRENIRYGRLDATDADIIEAVRKANVDGFLEDLPQGLDTPVGDNGSRISGGQRQRIALARAFLRNPEVLILDEATNALDRVSEQWIQSMVERFGGQCTVLIAAHRFSTIQNADHVIVLEGGRVIEQGRPAQLRIENGLFARLCELQSVAFATEGT
jgi:subfamily B ATP-binding cassette protein MsbA